MTYDKAELKEIGDLVRKHRGDRPQSWLAEEVGTKTAAISYIEKGHRPVPRNKVKKFATILGIDAERLVPTKVSSLALQELQDIGIGFRELETLPAEAREKFKNQVINYYRQLKEQYKDGTLGQGKKTIEEVVQDVLDKSGIKKAPVDLTKILQKFKIDAEESSTIAAEGVLVYSKSQKWAGIKYRAGLTEGRRRFTIAHELGHYFLENVEGGETSCSIDGEGNNKEQERQANSFASSLLMPTEWVRSSISQSIKGIEDVLSISKQFEVSQTAAAIRLVQLIESPCAVIYSKDRKIGWGYTSPKLYARVSKGEKLSRGSQAYKLSNGQSAMKPVPSKSEYWFDAKVTGKFMEHSAQIYKDSVLTLVWVRTK